ncbi:L-threonylcarbamoyladenylate synthase [Candidatus Enterococcus willemsii]|uniref:Threonylcarbamoyl-AMP synthase n=1 Tax=Candidatus Enterococcus willemsii TaxID=1857215 RepID=A0ABQ6Z1G4_9ENTE|nr:L-threonylcarbamoyladenylate synthase [Enterococcus sp. CU12B]KAF1304549.1 threonylcarbamoyl-AMP synthase [Enterococcus sp. CU12B]
METKKIDTNINEAIEILKSDGLVAFPTETVYGLGANALSETAVKRVFAVKGRPSDNPLIVHVADFEQVKQYVTNFHPLTEKLVDMYWPGPLTLILEPKAGIFPSVVSAGLKTISFRMPNNTKTLALLREANLPLVGPSANTSGRPSPTSAEHVYHDLNGKIEGILDDGSTSIGVESTVLDISDPTKPPMILRPGAITKEQLETDLGIKIALDSYLIKENDTPKSPGMKYKHYSPETNVLMVREEDWHRAVTYAKERQLKVGVMAGPSVAEKVRADTAAVFMYQDDSVEAATRGLFAGLRALDEPLLDLDLILVATFPEEKLGVAYMNRLKKAAAQQYFD